MRRLFILILAAALLMSIYAAAHNLLAPKSASQTALHAQMVGRSNPFLLAATSTVSPFHQVDFNWL